MSANFFWSVLFPLIVICCFLATGLIIMVCRPSLWHLLGPRKMRWVIVLTLVNNDTGIKIHYFNEDLTLKEVEC